MGISVGDIASAVLRLNLIVCLEGYDENPKAVEMRGGDHLSGAQYLSATENLLSVIN